MAEHVLLEIGDYIAFCQAYEAASGKWESSVAFERKADQGQTLVSGLRHKVGNGFASRTEAIGAATTYAHAHAEAGDTGLE